MRHRKHSNQLGVKKEHRTALLANLSTALITHGRIKTTLKKAKALRPFVEKVITLAKNGDVHNRRMAIARVRDTDAVHVLFDEKVEQFRERNGGYTRIYKVGNRRGDAAEMALIELIDADDEGYAKKSKPKSKAKKVEAAPEAVAEEAVVEEAVVEEAVAEEAVAEEAVVEEAVVEEAVAEEAVAEEAVVEEAVVEEAVAEEAVVEEPAAEVEATSEEPEEKKGE